MGSESTVNRSVKGVMPNAMRARVTKLYRPLLYRGSDVSCPLCDGSFRTFVPHRGRKSVRCPRCGSMERHRLLWLWMQDQDFFTRPGLRVLHIAPEAGVRAALLRLPDVRYTGADLESELADEHFDVTDIPHEDESYDLILCNHVLEHVPDDIKAMSELRRVLATDGVAILMSPIGRDRAETFHDPAAQSPEERLEAFGQEDHARLYGSDYDERLRSAGWAVERIDPLTTLGHQDIAKYGLRQAHALFEDDVVHVGRRDATASPSGAEAGAVS